MERSSEVILRNTAKLPDPDLLLINPPRDSMARQLEQAGKSVRILSQNHGDYRWHVSSSTDVQFGITPKPIETPCTAILHLPREKELLGMMLHALSATMTDDSSLWLVGENKAGIKSAKRHLDRYFGQVSKLDSARHCGLFAAAVPLPVEPFSLADYAINWQSTYAGKSLEIVSLPGVFAHGRLDQGSALLLDTLESLHPRGAILDFACGSGVIGGSLLSAEPGATVTLLDVSSLAVESSRLTLEANGLRASVLPSDGLNQVEDRYDWIVSNPPFHQGIHNDLDIAAGFFASSGTFLAEKGRIVIVCNRHLPYSNWLRNDFEQVEKLNVDDRFEVIMASGPRIRQEHNR